MPSPDPTDLPSPPQAATTPEPAATGSPAPLAYAPTAQPGSPARRTLIVLAVGAALSLAIIVASHALLLATGGDLDLGMLFVARILPLGALALGVGMGLGYGLVARRIGCRLRLPTLAAIAVLTLAMHLAGQFLTYTSARVPIDPSTGRPLSFLKHYDAVTRSFYFRPAPDGSSPPFRFNNRGVLTTDDPQTLGPYGYAIRLLQAGGMALAAVALAASTTRGRYCDYCQRYMTARPLALLPASKPFQPKKGFQVSSEPLFDAEDQHLLEAAQDSARQVSTALERQDPQRAIELLRSLTAPPSLTHQAIRNLKLTLSRCSGCGHGVFETTTQVGLQGRAIRIVSTAATPVDPQTTAALLGTTVPQTR